MAAHWTGRSNTVAACSSKSQDRPPLLGHVQGIPQRDGPCPMDDVIPSPLRRQLHTAYGAGV